MKATVIFALVTCIFSEVSGQNKFNKIFPEQVNFHIVERFEFNGKYFALLPSDAYSIDNSGTQVCEITDTLGLTNCKLLTEKSVFSRCIGLGDNLLCVGILYGNGNILDSLVLEIRNKELQLLNFKHFAISKDYDSSNIIVNDSIRVFATSLSSNYSLNFQEFIIPKSFDLEKLTVKKHNLPAELIISLTEDKIDSGYICYMWSGIYKVDKEFINFQKLDTLINFKAGSIIAAIDSGYVVFGNAIDTKTGSSTALGITKISTAMNYITSDLFDNSPKSYDYPAIYDAIDKDSDYYYVSGMIGIQADNYTSKVPNYFYIGKYNSNIKRTWLKSYGGDSHYVIYGIYSMGDGNCCIYGFMRDSSANFDMIPFIMCFNSDGNITSYQEQHPEQNKAFKLKVNPAKDQFKLSNVSQQSNCVYEIIDISGRMVQNGIIEFTENVIGVSTLPPAFYNLVIKDQNGKMLQTEKLIKTE